MLRRSSLEGDLPQRRLVLVRGFVYYPLAVRRASRAESVGEVLGIFAIQSRSPDLSLVFPAGHVNKVAAITTGAWSEVIVAVVDQTRLVAAIWADHVESGHCGTQEAAVWRPTGR